MNSKSNFLIVVFFTIIWTSMVFLPEFVYAGAGWTDSVTVGELIPTSSHYYVVRLQVNKNPSGCKNKTMFYEDYDAQGADKKYETILQAIKSGISLRVYVTGGCNVDGYSEISAVSVAP